MGNLWSILGAILMTAALGLIYSWKVEADKAAELQAKIELLEQKIHADNFVMEQRDKARSEAERKAREMSDAIQKGFEGLTDDELLCRLHGLCAKGAGAGSADGAAGKPAGGMSATSKTGGHD